MEVANALIRSARRPQQVSAQENLERKWQELTRAKEELEMLEKSMEASGDSTNACWENGLRKAVLAVMVAMEELERAKEAAVAAATAGSPLAGGGVRKEIKAVRAAHPGGLDSVVLSAAFPRAKDEADNIALSIKQGRQHWQQHHGEQQGQGTGGGAAPPTEAILCRRRDMFPPIEEALKQHNVPYEVSGGKPFWEYEVRIPAPGCH